ncbi:MAG: hypothetical protein H7Z75_19880 [Ferruginibacter sp.]|nr:hypothetical protein [Cytophagales bacterium]
MIICKPKGATLFSLGTVALICYGAGVFLLVNNSQRTEHPASFYPLLAGLLLAALLLTLRLAFGYKVILAQNGKITVKQQFLLRHRRFDLRDLLDWDEIVIKTFNGEYRQLKLHFTNGRLHISKSEYANYESLKSYVRQKSASRKARS